MGLSFHYSGKISNPDALATLIDDIKDIVKVFEWEFSIYETKFHPDSFEKAEYNDSIYGISFNPPNCEPVFICFLSNGKMSSPVHLTFYGKTASRQESDYLYMLSVKTQFAGIEIHKQLMYLFKYISEKYLSNFRLNDEGLFWGVWKEEILVDKFREFTQLLENFEMLIDCTPIVKGEEINDYIKRLIERMRNSTNEK